MVEQVTKLSMKSPVTPSQLQIPKIAKPSSTALMDLSLNKRIGVRGTLASSFLKASGFTLPEQVNQVVDADGHSVIQLPSNEYWVMSYTDEMALPSLTEHKDCYEVFCQHTHAWFVVKSTHTPDMLAKLCGVDCRSAAFPVGAVAQTFVAGCQCIVVHHYLAGEAVFSLLSDRSVAHYLWDMLLDAFTEYGSEVTASSGLST